MFEGIDLSHLLSLYTYTPSVYSTLQVETLIDTFFLLQSKLNLIYSNVIGLFLQTPNRI